jgi:AraC-like DNA-binding protein
MGGMERLAELRELIGRLAADQPRSPWIDGMTVFRTDQVTSPLGSVTRPMLGLVAQGAKRTVLGERIFDYQAGQYIVTTVHLPLVGQIIRASGAEPFLGFGLPLDPSVIARLLLEADPATGGRDGEARGVVMSDADGELLDAVIRLLRLVERPADFRMLGKAIVREIHWRLMNGPQGATVRQIGLADSRLSLVSGAVRWIQEHYDQVIRVDDLARHVGMSTSSLNRHFRAVTAMSPLQYQKQLRLQKARIELIAAPDDVAAVGYAVGYDSPSQFSREYRRLFGAPPGRDAARLQQEVVVTEG